MDIKDVINVSLHMIKSFSYKSSLQEFELLAYEQACRTLEVVLRDFRETWETEDDFRNIKR